MLPAAIRPFQSERDAVCAGLSRRRRGRVFQYEMLCPFFWQGRLQTGSNLAYDVFMSAGRLNGGRNPPHSRRFLALLCSVAL